jgi:hypothetical protein
MSCRNFGTVLTEMARGQMLDADVRENALEHIKACQTCAARLADERALTAGLRNVASIQAAMNAPAGVESALVSAFRRRGQSPVAPAIAPASRTLSRWAALGIAAAAALLVVSALAVTRLLYVDSHQSVKRESQMAQPTPASSPSVAKNEPEQPAIDPGALPSPLNGRQVVGGIPAPSLSDERSRELIRDVKVNNRPIRSSLPYRPAAKANEEVSTEFMPLTYGGLSQVDDGLVIRVEVPRSALQSFGLPVNVERAGERVKADVLLGHDGVARAIRFVR